MGSIGQNEAAPARPGGAVSLFALGPQLGRRLAEAEERPARTDFDVPLSGQ